MIKRKLLLSMLALTVSASFLFTGCQEKDYYEPSITPEDNSGDASTITYSTTQHVAFDFSNVLSNGLITTFDVYAQNPYTQSNSGSWLEKEGLTPIAGGINVMGTSNITRTLPTYATELYVRSTSLFAPKLMYAKIESGIAVFEEFFIDNPIATEASTRTFGNGKVDHYLKSILTRSGDSKNYRYKPTIDKTEVFPTTVKNSIAATFPEGKRAQSIYYDDATIEIKQEDSKDEGAELWLSVIHSNCSYNSSLSYFCYTGEKELSQLTDDEKNQLHIISAFQYAKLGNDSKSGLQAGEYVKLKYFDGQNYVDKFPVGAKIGWVLSADAFTVGKSAGSSNEYNCTTANKSKSKPWFYSISSWNPEPNDKNHTIIFAAQYAGKDYICFGFEDTPNEKIDGMGPGDRDCNDVMFHIIANPIKALDPPPYIPEEGTIEKTESTKGILTFEDNWPCKGDYDLNDVVVSYNSEITYVQKTLDGTPVGDVTLKRIKDNYSFLYSGAVFENGFSLKMEIPSSLVSSVKVDNVECKTTPDGSGFILDLCEDIKTLSLPKTYGVALSFNEDGITQDNFNEILYAKAPYNPFIRPINPSINTGMADIEVHLPFYPPTERVDLSLFGQDADCSDINSGVYYATEEGIYYPFALHLLGAESFVIPVEAEPIDYTYPKYLNWVNCGCGTTDADWYKHPN